MLEDNWYDLITLNYYPHGNRKIYPGVFYHFDNNLMFRVDTRHQYGIGIGSVLDKGAVKFSVSTTLAIENSTFAGFEYSNSEIEVSNRKNGLFLFKLNNGYSIADKRVDFSYQLFYFQSLKESADYDIWFKSRIDFMVLKNLFFHIDYGYRFENAHLKSLSNFNDIVLFGFRWTKGNVAL